MVNVIRLCNARLGLAPLAVRGSAASTQAPEADLRTSQGRWSHSTLARRCSLRADWPPTVQPQALPRGAAEKRSETSVHLQGLETLGAVRIQTATAPRPQLSTFALAGLDRRRSYLLGAPKTGRLPPWVVRVLFSSRRVLVASPTVDSALAAVGLQPGCFENLSLPLSYSLAI